MGRRQITQKVSEAQVLKAVKQLLESKGFRVWRRNTGAVRAAYTSKRTGKTSKRFVRFSEKGAADLWGWQWRSIFGWNPKQFVGKHLEVEVKAPGKRPTGEQELWLKNAINDGCIAFWCDSVDMAEAKLKEWGL